MMLICFDVKEMFALENDLCLSKKDDVFLK